MIRKRFQGMFTTVENGGEKEGMGKEGIRVSQDLGADEGFRVSEAQAEEKVDMGREEGKVGLGFGEAAQGGKTFRRRPHRKLRLFDDDEDDDVGVVGVGFGVLEAIGSEADAQMELQGVEIQKTMTDVEDQVGPSMRGSAEVEVIGKGGDDVEADVEFRVLRRKRKEVVEGDVDDKSDVLVKKIKMEDNNDGEIERKLKGSEIKHNADGGDLVRDSAKGDVNGDRTLVKFGKDDRGKKILRRQRENKLSRAELAMGAKKLDHMMMPNGDSIQALKQGILLKPNAGGGLIKNNKSETGVVLSDSLVKKNKSEIGVVLSEGLIKQNKSEIGVVSSDSLVKKNKSEVGVVSSDSLIKKNKTGAGVGSSYGVVRRNKPRADVGSPAGDDRGTMGTSTTILKKSNVAGIVTQSGSRSLNQNSFRRDNRSDVQGKGKPILVRLKSDSLAAYQEQRRMLKRSQSFKNDKMVSTERKATKPSIEEEAKTVNNFLPKERKTGEPSLTKGTKTKTRIERSEERKKLRERLRAALLAAGWTIDLRPRRDKNYDDNVYISPSGTSFWSLPKAWHALTASLDKGSVNDNDLSKMEGEITKQVVKVSRGGDSPPNMLGSMVRNEDLSLLKRKRRKGMGDSEKGEDDTVKKKRKRRKTSHEYSSDENIDNNKKDGKRVKILKSSTVENDELSLSEKRKLARDGIISPDVKFKEKQKKIRDSSPKVLDKNNIYDKNSKRRMHGDTERKHSTPKATSNGVKIGSSQGKKNKNRKGGCGLLVRSSAKGDKRTVDQGASPIHKRTVLSWLIDVGVVPEKECVQYWNKKGTRIMLEGWIHRDGILCECCNKVISVSKFEDHAGATRHQPFENIYLQSGKSLTLCLLEAWDTLDEVWKCGKSVVEVDEDDQNDDTCGHCGDGGNLICCDKCPSTFHDGCLKLEDVPLGDWYCLNCTCRICGTVGHVGQNSTNHMPLVICQQCEHEYHSKCLQDTGMQMSSSISSNSSFCGRACEKICMGLHQLLGTSNPLPDGFSWTLLRRFDDDQKMQSIHGPSRARMAECNAKLAVAHVVMDECFMPIIDQRTNIDMVSNVVFSCWSNFNRLNYKGFYTVVLEKDDELISVASIRIHGACLAEMPLIGTRHHYRRQGMCRRLVNAIEKMLSSLEVEKLILPAVPDLLQTWNVAFGFKPLEESHKDEIRHLNLMVFPGTDMLQKQICKGETLANESTGGGDDCL